MGEGVNFRLICVGMVVLAAGCDRHASDDPIGDRVRAAVPRIEKATGLTFKTPPKYELRSRDEVRAFLLKKFDEDMSAEELRGQEMAFKAFGFVPDTMKLRNFLIDLLTEQIVGYYDPATKTLYVVKDAPEDMTGITVVHELVHALQDQYANLDSIQKSKGDSDREAAAQAVFEGQAMLIQLQDMLGGADVASRLPGGWEGMRQQIRENQSAMPQFSNAPMAIQESMLFPYLAGAEFVRRYQVRKDPRSPLDKLPVSTEQILSEEAFFGSRPDLPMRVTLPGRKAAGDFEEIMGEFGTRLFLYQHGKDNSAAVGAAHGWGGDRYRIVNTAQGRGVIWATAWDTPLDAAQFVDALGEAISKRYRTGASSRASNGVRTYEGQGRIVVVTPREVSGANVVLMVDVPVGTPTALIDPAQIRVGRE